MIQDQEEAFCLVRLSEPGIYHSVRMLPGSRRLSRAEIVDLKNNSTFSEEPTVVPCTMRGQGIHRTYTVLPEYVVQSKPSRPPLDSPEVRIGQWLWRLSTLAKDRASQRALSWAAGALARGECTLDQLENLPEDLFDRDG